MAERSPRAPGAGGDARAQAAARLREALDASGAPWTEVGPFEYAVTLAGERKLKTECLLSVGEHSLSVSAFVARCPDENHEGVWRWLLERNARMFGVAFAVDRAGDIYLVGRLPLELGQDDVDRLLGSVLEHADSSFNVILELGFRSAIRKEWRWRLDRGEPTTNLTAFEHLRPDLPEH